MNADCVEDSLSKLGERWFTWTDKLESECDFFYPLEIP